MLFGAVVVALVAVAGTLVGIYNWPEDEELKKKALASMQATVCKVSLDIFLISLILIFIIALITDELSSYISTKVMPAIAPKARFYASCGVFASIATALLGHVLLEVHVITLFEIPQDLSSPVYGVVSCGTMSEKFGVVLIVVSNVYYAWFIWNYRQSSILLHEVGRVISLYILSIIFLRRSTDFLLIMISLSNVICFMLSWLKLALCFQLNPAATFVLKLGLAVTRWLSLIVIPFSAVLLWYSPRLEIFYPMEIIFLEIAYVIIIVRGFSLMIRNFWEMLMM